MLDLYSKPLSPTTGRRLAMANLCADLLLLAFVPGVVGWMAWTIGICAALNGLLVFVIPSRKILEMLQEQTAQHALEASEG